MRVDALRNALGRVVLVGGCSHAVGRVRRALERAGFGVSGTFAAPDACALGARKFVVVSVFNARAATARMDCAHSRAAFSERRHWRRACLALAVLVLAVTPQLGAQNPVRPAAPVVVNYDVTCPRCTVEFGPSVTLDTADHVPLLGGVSGIARDSKGRFYVGDYSRSQVLVFAPDGKFVRTIGGRGNGPGEFGTSVFGVQRIRVSEFDTLYVHFSPSKIAVFSPSWLHVRTMAFRGGDFNFDVLGNGELLLLSRISSALQVGEPLHRYTPGGQHVRSFGGDNLPVLPGGLPQTWTTPALTSDRRTVWYANGGDRYRVKQATMDGVVLRDFDVIGVPWLVKMVWPADRARRASETVLPTPGSDIEISGVDSRGLVWINSTTPSVDRTQNIRRTDIFDPSIGRVIYSADVPRHVYFISGTDITYRFSRNDDDFIRVAIAPVVFRRP